MLTVVIDTIVSFIVFPLTSEQMGAIDGEGYAKLATTMLDCGKFAFNCDVGSTVFRGPGYPAFLALINLPFGAVQYEWSVIVQILINAASAVLVYKVAQRLYNERTARIAVLLFLCMPLLHVFIPRFHLENLLMFLLLGIVSLLARDVEALRVRHLVGAALLIGYAILVKQTILLLPVLLSFLLLYRGVRRSRVMIILFIPYLIVLPWSIRSSALAESVVPVHVNAGMNVVIGNSVVRNFWQSPYEGKQLWWEGMKECRKIVPEANRYTAVLESNEDRLLLAAGLKDMLTPEFIFRKLSTNLLLLFSLGSSPLNSAMIGLPWLLVLPFSLIGLRKHRAMFHSNSLILSIAFYLILLHLPIYSIGRFAIPFAPLLLLPAAAALQGFASSIMLRSARSKDIANC